MATNWDKTQPVATDILRVSDDKLRGNFGALDDALARNHNFPGDETLDAGEHTVVEFQDQAGDPITPSGVVALYNNGDKLYLRKASSGVISRIDQPFPSGTKLLFPQNAAPTGWTFSATNNDSVIMNQSTEADGGDTGGSWTISGVTVDGHKLTIAEMPSHTHQMKHKDTGAGTGILRVNDQGTDETTTATGGDGEHAHGLTSDAAWRPAWLGVITCIKD
ncbi:MAG: hypothetical protein DRI71_05875 [Bacteroidetes bacterium]|nr:MAG: hypothetical protein DRI71_05875 [Bacteroidota bacterium]